MTAEERKLVEKHPELGERIIAPIDRLEEVRPIVRHCHERYDGTGYPDRKLGEDIPIESRIILVCDAYHAMTTDRPYRKRLPKEEALRRLDEGAGTQFDPAVVEVCKASSRGVAFRALTATGRRVKASSPSVKLTYGTAGNAASRSRRRASSSSARSRRRMLSCCAARPA